MLCERNTRAVGEPPSFGDGGASMPMPPYTASKVPGAGGGFLSGCVGGGAPRMGEVSREPSLGGRKALRENPARATCSMELAESGGDGGGWRASTVRRRGSGGAERSRDPDADDAELIS